MLNNIHYFVIHFSVYKYHVITIYLDMTCVSNHTDATMPNILSIIIGDIRYKGIYTRTGWLVITSIKNVGWNYVSIPKLQRYNRWSLEMYK